MTFASRERFKERKYSYMKKKVLASTKPGYELPIEQAIEFSGLEAGMCYMPDNVDALFSEDKEKL